MAVGTKLQVILARMALEISDRHVVVLGMPLVQSSDRYFWFNQPQFLLHLIHFALFQVLINCLKCQLSNFFNQIYIIYSLVLAEFISNNIYLVDMGK